MVMLFQIVMFCGVDLVQFLPIGTVYGDFPYISAIFSEFGINSIRGVTFEWEVCRRLRMLPLKNLYFPDCCYRLVFPSLFRAGGA